MDIIIVIEHDVEDGYTLLFKVNNLILGVMQILMSIQMMMMTY